MQAQGMQAANHAGAGLTAGAVSRARPGAQAEAVAPTAVPSAPC